MREGDTRDLPITSAHALAVQNLPPHHADPFDRMLIAQAQSEGLTLVTADLRIRAYDIRTLDATV
jgi:PIN domain nuclease of toxin-antitoxin system